MIALSNDSINLEPVTIGKIFHYFLNITSLLVVLWSVLFYAQNQRHSQRKRNFGHIDKLCKATVVNLLISYNA